MILSYLPVSIFSISVLFGDSAQISDIIESLIFINFYGFIFFFPVLLSSALVVKILQKYDNDTVTSATLGSLFAVVILALAVLISRTIAVGNIIIYIAVFILGFISVLIEDKIFKGKR